MAKFSSLNIDTSAYKACEICEKIFKGYEDACPHCKALLIIAEMARHSNYEVEY